jgi:hypothetical protein
MTGFSYTQTTSTGLTKRELFAAMAMQGFLATGIYDRWSNPDLTRNCTGLADDLITELEKTSEEGKKSDDTPV